MTVRLVFGYALFGLGAVISVANFYNSFLRQSVHRLLNREYHWASSLPLVGSVFLFASGRTISQRTQPAPGGADTLLVRYRRHSLVHRSGDCNVAAISAHLRE